MKYHLLYKITNTVTKKIYIGIHSTDNIFDGYRGSGKLLLKAYKKYDQHDFMYEILSTHKSREDLLSAERRLVNKEFVAREDTYNLKIGGEGGSVLGRSQSDETKAKISIAQKGKPKHSGFSDKCRLGQLGKKQSLETIEKRSNSLSGQNNGLYGVKSSRRGPHWEFYDELKKIWDDNDQPKAHKFNKLAVANGYPDVNYLKMVMMFQAKLKFIGN